MTALEWLLESDPAIRWQAMRSLTDEPAEIVIAERARVATEGWGATLLAGQGPGGYWGGEAPNPEWASLQTLLLLRDLGLDPRSERAGRAVALVRANVTWHGVLPQDAAWHGRPLFSGEVEPCINGRVVAVGSYFGQNVQSVVDRLLGEQLSDGGWNCEAERGSTRGSFHTTINVLEGLLEHEHGARDSAESRAARLRGQEYILERRLFRRLSTGKIVDPGFTQFSFPTGYHYDVLRGLDYLRSATAIPDKRIKEAVDLVVRRRGKDGRWPLQNLHPDQLDFDMGEREGEPSRWITLRAMRVLRWAHAG